MKKKILTLIGGLAFIALMAVNFQSVTDSDILGNINLKVLAQNAMAEEEGGPGGGVTCNSSTACDEGGSGSYTWHYRSGWSSALAKWVCCSKITSRMRGCKED